MFVVKKTFADLFDKAKCLVWFFYVSRAAGSLCYYLPEPKINWKKQGQGKQQICAESGSVRSIPM